MKMEQRAVCCGTVKRVLKNGEGDGVEMALLSQNGDGAKSADLLEL